MIIFLHMHKAGGTTVIRAAEKSGLKFPRHHQNGALLDEKTGNWVFFGQLERAEIRRTIEDLAADGVDFLSMEWDFPEFGLLPLDMNLQFVTVLRDPLRRAISNFRYDIVNGYAWDKSNFGEYYNEDTRYVSHNYYCRQLSNAQLNEPITEDHFREAVSVLQRFDEVLILEQAGIGEALRKFGIIVSDDMRHNVTAESSAFREYNGQTNLEVSKDERISFFKKNTFDFALYAEFAGGGSSGDLRESW